MTTREQLDRWLADGTVTASQHAMLDAVSSRRLVSIFLELNALLYAGVVAVAGGLAWTAREYAAEWGDAAIILPLTALLAGCVFYCVSKAPAYSNQRVEPPALAFDYVLYLACLAFAVEVGYVEFRFHLLGERWNYYLLASTIVYLLTAYRFDNRFVLSLGIATLGSWFGVRLSYQPLFGPEAFRLAALTYGLTLAALGFGLHRARIKPHFLDTYLHVAVNVALASLVSGMGPSPAGSIWTLALLAAAGAVVSGGVRFRRFAFVVYGVVYAYIGISRELLRSVASATAMLSYLVVSAGIVIVGLVMLSRRFGHEE